MNVFGSRKRRVVGVAGGLVLLLAVALIAMSAKAPVTGPTSQPGADAHEKIARAGMAEGVTRTITNRFDMEFVEIPAGRFVMGSSRGEPDEKPLHLVLITRPFFLGVTEVTERQRILIRIAAGRISRSEHGVPSSEHELADCIASWEEANQLAVTLSNIDPKYRYRLPTEAEWEYACRHAMNSVSASRSQPQVRQPGRDDCSEIGPIKVERPNAIGLYDMLRNVGEYCSDWYAADYYSCSALENPAGPEEGRLRVARGVRSGGREDSYSATRRYPVQPQGDGNTVIGVRFILETKVPLQR